jgi:hypothetical protein
VLVAEPEAKGGRQRLRLRAARRHGCHAALNVVAQRNLARSGARRASGAATPRSHARSGFARGFARGCRRVVRSSNTLRLVACAVVARQPSQHIGAPLAPRRCCTRESAHDRIGHGPLDQTTAQLAS